MKTDTSDMWRVTSDELKDTVREVCSRHPSPATRHPSAFTLIELLVVIAIMGTLAALLLPVVGAVKKHQYIFNAQAEMARLQTALDRYKSAYGYYPPGTNALASQLYYELVGTTNNSGVYQTLDGSAQISAGNISTAFGVGGFINCTRSGGEDATAARNFLPDLKPNQIGTNSAGVAILVSAVGGPDATYQPLGLGMSGVNPWRYLCAGTNNPGSYDLWLQLSISGKTNLICNWSKSVRINSPLP